MPDSIFNYELIDTESDIINHENFEENSDEAKLLCLLFGCLTITKGLDEEKIQTRNFFILDGSEISDTIFEHTRILQTKLQNFENEIMDNELDGTHEDLVNKLKSLKIPLNYLLEEEQRTKSKPLDKFLIEEFSLQASNKTVLRKYFTHMNRHNKEFQSVLLFEVTMFFFKCEESPTTAFLHLYRIIELLCFNIPLVYTSKETSYVGAFIQLKKFFSNDAKEFVFFKTFLRLLFKDEEEILEEKLIFFINSDNVKHIRNDLDRVFSLDQDKNEKVRWEFEILEDNKSAKCTIPFKNIIDFVVNIRNRYFHLSDGSGNPNIKNKNYDMDCVFKQLNFSILNCLSLILLSVSKHSFSSYSIFFEEKEDINL